MIRLVNIKHYKRTRDEKLIRIDRKSTVGNPFYIRNESDRDKVCDDYEKYFNQQIIINPKFKNFLEYIVKESESQNIALGCWCSPKRCHGQTILNYINIGMRIIGVDLASGNDKSIIDGKVIE